MSLEVAIEKLTAELKRFNDYAHLIVSSNQTAPATDSAEPAPKTETKKAEAKAEAKAEVKKPVAKAEPKKTVEPAPTAPAEGVTFAEVQKKAIEYVTAHDRTALVNVLADFGIAKVSDAKDDPELLKQIDAALSV